MGSDLDCTPTLVGKIKIKPAGMFGDAGMDGPLGGIELGARASFGALLRGSGIELFRIQARSARVL
jgi:hypothetical protein